VNLATLSAVTKELETALVGQRFGKLFTLSRFQFAIDFRLTGSRYLFISVEPSSPRIYMITRRLRDLEKQSSNPNAFAVYTQKRLTSMTVVSVKQVDDERVLSIALSGRDEMDVDRSFSLVAQLTGRSANLFLLDENERIIESLRDTNGPGQVPGDVYSPPLRETSHRPSEKLLPVEVEGRETLSQRLDEMYLASEHDARVRSLANAARTKLRRQITKLERLNGKLDADAAGHGDAEKWKRFGDLLLANVGTAKRNGSNFVVVDYYDESMPEVEVAADENASVTEAAETYFKRYAKARNSIEEIAKRRTELQAELKRLNVRSERLEQAIADGDEAAIADFEGEKKPEIAQRSRSGMHVETNAFARSFVSSDGFEILVGKKAKDNDHLSFKIAKSLDLWMHAADYPGSHVVIRNPNRQEIPSRTLFEAAQLAAFYSQGRAQIKAAVHYTQKKFVNKPRGAAPGLVSLASFKTILVEPRVPDLARADQ
jgi:predicted ribosome quality control (RQC) complex YloA/Tae2 family protein